MGAHEFSLLALPHELLVAVLQHVSSARDLSMLSRASRRLCDIVEPFLYGTAPFLQAGAESQIASFTEALNAKQHRKHLVRQVRINRPEHLADSDYEALPLLLKSLPDLRGIAVEALPGYSIDAPDEERLKRRTEMSRKLRKIFTNASLVIAEPESRVLPALLSCTLCFSDANSPPWSLTSQWSIFLHPTLLTLKIYRAYVREATSLLESIPDDLRDKSTPLTMLHLEHCNISPGGIGTLLRIPKALKNLSLIDGLDQRNSQGEPTLISLEMTMALLPQKDTLERLHIEFWPKATSSTIGELQDFLVLRHMVALRYLTTDRFTMFCICGLRGEFSYRSLGFIPPFHAVLPPNIRSISIEGVFFMEELIDLAKEEGRVQVQDLMRYLVMNKEAQRLSNLETVQLTFESASDTRDEDRISLIRLVDACRNNNIRLLISSMTPSTVFQPPFFEGESVPRITQEYDSWTMPTPIFTGVYRLDLEDRILRMKEKDWVGPQGEPQWERGAPTPGLRKTSGLDKP